MAEATPNRDSLVLGLPLFSGADARIEQVSAVPGCWLYRVRSRDLIAGVRVYGPTVEEERTPAERAAAESAGLVRFSTVGLAPDLLWQGRLDRGDGAPVVAYRWPAGVPGSAWTPPAEAVVSLARSLHTLHSAPPDLKLLSPHPRSLERWWEQTHEKYRELPEGLLYSLPATVRGALARLVNAVAADAQAHKRFWASAVLAPVHGTATLDNLWMSRDRAVLVDWQRFGLGDPAYEMAVAGSLISMQVGEDAAERFVGTYLDADPDDMLARRITLYRRMWPFEYLLRVLDATWTLAQAEERAWVAAARPLVHVTAILSRFIELCMRTYEWRSAEIDATNRDLQEWVADLELAMERRVGRR